MRRSWRSNRLVFLLVLLMACGGLIVGSNLGLLTPVEGLLSVPLNAMTGLVNRFNFGLGSFSAEFANLQALRARNAELETQLARITSELVQLREIASDYNRLNNLLDYTSSTQNQEFVTADVIGFDQIGLVRSIIINRGTRDGISLGMPVVSDLGLVGRIFAITANSAQVQLITDQNSAVSGRLQSSRAEGSVEGRGLATGNMRMRFIPLDAEIVEGDLVITSGLGGNFPPDLVIGQVTSKLSLEFELYQEAEVVSLIDFNTLEFVLVVTSFEPADLSLFEEGE